MVGIEVHYVFPYIKERVCVGLRKIFPLSMEVYFCYFGFDIRHQSQKIYICKCLAKVSIIAHPFELMKYFLPQVDNGRWLLSTYTLGTYCLLSTHSGHNNC